MVPWRYFVVRSNCSPKYKIEKIVFLKRKSDKLLLLNIIYYNILNFVFFAFSLGMWNDISCSSANNFICEKHNSSINSTLLSPLPPGGCPESWIFFNNKVRQQISSVNCVKQQNWKENPKKNLNFLHEYKVNLETNYLVKMCRLDVWAFFLDDYIHLTLQRNTVKVDVCWIYFREHSLCRLAIHCYCLRKPLLFSCTLFCLEKRVYNGKSCKKGIKVYKECIWAIPSACRSSQSLNSERWYPTTIVLSTALHSDTVWKSSLL